MRRALLLALCLGSSALAQQRLVVDGVPVIGLTTELVAGTSYVPAEAYARALGAIYRFDPQTGLLLEFGGRYLSLKSVSDPAQAAGVQGALVLDGRTLPGPAAVSRGSVAYLPVKSVTEALGGRAAYLEPLQTVAVIFPRPQLLSVTPPGVWGSFERFVLAFSAPVTLEPFYEASLRVARFRFPRAELEASSRLPAGSRYSDAVLIPETSYLDFNLTLREGNDYSVFSEPSGNGERVVIDVFKNDAEQAAARPRLTLAAAAGTEGLATRLQAALQRQGIEADLLRDQGAASLSGFAAPFLLALGRAPLAAGRFNIYYLSDDAALTTLRTPLRLASVAATLSPQGSARLTRLAPDLRRGERAAAQLASGLEQRTSLRRAGVVAAPLLALSGAAGRGLMLELSAWELADPALIEPLAASLAALMRRP